MPGCAAVGEADLYQAHCKTLMAIGVQIALPTATTHGEGDSAITVREWPVKTRVDTTSEDAATAHTAPVSQRHPTGD